MPLYIYIIKFKEKNFNLNRDSNSDLQTSSLALYHLAILVQEENLKVNCQENQDSSMVERQAKDLEVRVRVLVQVKMFILKFNKDFQYHVNTLAYLLVSITSLYFKIKIKFLK